MQLQMGAGPVLQTVKTPFSKGRPAQRGVRLSAEQAKALEDTAEALRALGHEVVDFEPSYPELLPALAPQIYGGVRDEVAFVERPELARKLREKARQGDLVLTLGAGDITHASEELLELLK